MQNIIIPMVTSEFPDTKQALQEPNGLLASSEVLSTELLLKAYHQGIFPWYTADEPVLWWTPNPRMVLFPSRFHCSKSLQKQLNQAPFQITLNQDFKQVIELCQSHHHNRTGTWITPDIKQTYQQLHLDNIAHSVEVWSNQQLIGGLYGIALGKIFFGESMVSLQPNASKIALALLCQFLAQHDFQCIDCQVYSPHLDSLGASLLPRTEFEDLLRTYTHQQPTPDLWSSRSLLW